eukprot:11227283-Lingulodinium_polyedra.AAC.1
MQSIRSIRTEWTHPIDFDPFRFESIWFGSIGSVQSIPSISIRVKSIEAFSQRFKPRQGFNPI